MDIDYASYFDKFEFQVLYPWVEDKVNCIVVL
jgi:hypothetical protein